MVIDWKDVKVENDIPLSGEDITNEVYDQTGVRITRQNISNTLKKAMGKIFMKLKDENKSMKHTDIAVMMFEMFTSFSNVSSVEDANAFFKLLPIEIRDEIKRENGIIKN